MPAMALLLAFLIGFLAGLRSLTPLAATAWAAHLGWLKLERPLSLMGSVPAVAMFTLFAAMELVADKLPFMPSRRLPPGLIARIVSGGVTGACVAASGAQGILPGAVLECRRRRRQLLRRHGARIVIAGAARDHASLLERIPA